MRQGAGGAVARESNTLLFLTPARSHSLVQRH